MPPSWKRPSVLLYCAISRSPCSTWTSTEVWPSAAEDKARKEEVDTHNNAEHLIYQTEKTLGELGDKISAEEKSSIEAAVEKLKEANKGSDLEAIKAASDELQKAFYAVSEKLYQQANPQGGAQGAQPGAQPGDDGVVDADYETVD